MLIFFFLFPVIIFFCYFILLLLLLLFFVIFYVGFLLKTVRTSIPLDFYQVYFSMICRHNTVELQWLGHLWNYENMFETGVVRANEC